MVKKTKTGVPPNLKEQNACYSFRVTVRDREHFYKLVNWLNTHVGFGKENWSMQGNVLKNLNSGKSISRKIYIFNESFDQETSLYLSLL